MYLLRRDNKYYLSMLLIFHIALGLSFSVFGARVHDCAAKGDIEGLEKAIKAEPTLIHLENEMGETPLHVAINSGQFTIIDWLCRHGAASVGNVKMLEHLISPLLCLPNEIQHEIYKHLSDGELRILKQTCTRIGSIIDNGSLEATYWFNQFPQQTRKKLAKTADGLKHEDGLVTLLKGWTDSQSVIDLLRDKKESKHFAAQLFYTLSQLMMGCESFTTRAKTLIEHQEPVKSVSFSANGSHLMTVSNRTVNLYEINKEGERIGRASIHHTYRAGSASLSPDGRTVATACRRGIASIHEIDEKGKWKEKALIQHRNDKRADLAKLSPAGNYVITRSEYGTVKLNERNKRGEWIEKDLIDDKTGSISFSPDESHVVTASGGTVKLYDINKEREWIEKASIQHHQKVLLARISPDGRSVVIASRDGTVKIHEIDEEGTLTEKATIQSGKDIVFIRAHFSPDGSHLVITSGIADESHLVINGGRDDTTAKIYERKGGKWAEKTSIQHTNIIDSVRFSPDGGSVATASRDGTAKIYERKEGAWIKKAVIQHQRNSWVNSALFSPDGSHVVTAGTGGTAKLYGRDKRGEWIEKASFDDGEVNSALFSPDGSHVVTASEDNNVRIYTLSP